MLSTLYMTHHKDPPLSDPDKAKIKVHLYLPHPISFCLRRNNFWNQLLPLSADPKNNLLFIVLSGYIMYQVGTQ